MMTVADTSHPDPTTLLAHRCGRLRGEAKEAVEAHLADCPKCSGRLGPPETETPPPAPLQDHSRYRILGQLGEGGMGVVYKAEHRVMGRTVALKVLTPGMTANATAIDRFRREVRIASRLTHPNIVTAYDADEAGGLHFLVMEFVEGESLDRLVARDGPLPVRAACEFVRQAAVGLQYAHAQGMIHRDIKPHNLMLARTGQIKILDFGLARLASGGGDPTSVTALELTQSRAVLGTPDFLSPEQARSATLDVRSDLYSLGCTLYFLLVGRPPFGGVGPFAKMIAHVREPVPDVTADRPGVPAGLGQVLDKLMAKLPEDRYQTALEVAEALAPFTIDQPEADVRPPAPATPASCPTAQLPLAVELSESSVAVVQTQTQPKTPLRPTKRRRLLGLALVVAVGLGVGGWAAQLGGSRHADHTEVPPTPPPTGTKPPATKPAVVEVAPLPHPAPAHGPRKKQILLVLPNEFANGELQTVLETLAQHHIGVVTVGTEKKPIDAYRYLGGDKGKVFVRTFTPDHGLRDLPDHFLEAMDGVIVINGDPRTFPARTQPGLDLERVIEKAVRRKVPIGATGAGVLVVGWLGYLEHRDASFVPGRPAGTSQVKVKKWVDDPKVVVDFPFITAGEFKHAKELVEAVVEAIPANGGR